MISVHRIREWTVIPEDLLSGMVRELLSENLVWVAEDWDTQEVLGILYAFGAHGVFFPARLAIAAHAPKHTALALLRRSFSDAISQGLVYFVTHFGLNDSERKLERLCERHGAFQSNDPGWYSGRLDMMLSKTLPISCPMVN